MTSKFLVAEFFFVVILCALNVGAQTSSFTYQGGLSESSTNANGLYDFTFRLFDNVTNGTQVGTDVVLDDVQVTAGTFKVQLDFGAAAFTPGTPRFLEILVRPGASTGAYTLLSPRQQFTSSPFSIKSLNANDSAMLGGQLPSAFSTSAQVTALQTQVTQLQSELAATTAGTQLWSKSLGSTAQELGQSAAVDSNGNVFVTGFFSGTVDFGGGNLVSAGSTDIFVAKYSGATGAYIWAKRFGGASQDFGSSIVVDASGNLFVTGGFNGSMDFGGPVLTSAGLDDVFLAKLSGTDGSHIWSRRFGSTSGDSGIGVGVDGTGNPTITGSFQGTVDFGGLPVVSAGSVDVFVAKYNGVTSTQIWSKGFGGTLGEVGEGIATDSSGNVFVTGLYTSSSINFGGPTLTNAAAGINDVFLAKLASADGSHMWSKRFGGTDNDPGLSVAVDGSGGVFATGHFASSSIDFGGGALNHLGSNTTFDIFLAKFDNGGTHQWSKAVGGNDNDLSFHVALDSNGNPVITGQFFSTTNLGGPSINSAGSSDIYAAKYSGSNGAHLWSRRFGGTSPEDSRGVAVDNTGDIFLIGTYNSTTIDFGGGPLTAAGSGDVFVAKLKK